MNEADNLEQVNHIPKSAGNRKVRITYRHFWKRFSPEHFYLDKLLRDNSSGRFVVDSVYPGFISKLTQRIGRRFRFISRVKMPNHDVSPEYQNKKKIWWTGENVRPPTDGQYSIFVSFDQDSYSGKNVTFPLIWDTILYPDLYFLSRVGIANLDADSLLQPRLPNKATEFCCTFINNPEPFRLRGIDELSKHGKVDIFGSHTRNSVKSKIEVATRYKFVMCFENDLFPGYITEKLLDAYLCGAVPLYWGDLGNEPHINRRAFINAKDFSSLYDFAKYVGNLSDVEYEKIQSEPLLNSLPSAEKLIKAIKNL